MKPEETLKKQIEHYYELQSLPQERLTELVAKTRDRDRERPTSRIAGPRPSRRPRLGWLGLAAGLLFVLAISWIGTLRWQQQQLVGAVAQEIALNHLKQLEPDFLAGTVADLASSMGELDFTLVDSRTVHDRGLRLVGARYCSIQGRLAAQLRLVDSAGRALTLYQAPLDGELSGLGGEETVRAGLRVRLWAEGGLLLGLAEPAES